MNGQDKPKYKCDEFLFFQGRMLVQSSFTLWMRSFRMLVGGALMILRGLPDKMKSLAKREQAPGVIACNVDYGRIGGVDLSHFPIMKESTQIYQDMNELDAQKRARTMPTNQAAANAKFRNRALPSNRFTKEVIK